MACSLNRASCDKWTSGSPGDMKHHPQLHSDINKIKWSNMTTCTDCIRFSNFDYTQIYNIAM